MTRHEDPKAARSTLHRLLGGWPERPALGAHAQAIEHRQDMVLERLTLASDASSAAPLPALLTRPPGPGPFPAMLYIHAHGANYALGKGELLDGRTSLQPGAYGPLLARLGFAALCIDLPCFGERQQPGEQMLAKRLLWQGDTLFGAMLRELASALDYLEARADIDASRIGAMGLSMGSTLAWWLAALDERVAAVAELCCLADLGTLVATGAHDLHGVYMTVPGLLQHFTTAEIAGLIVPRPHLCCLGGKDPLTPPAAIEAAVGPLASAYADAGASGAFELLLDPASGHEETPAMRAAVVAFLQRWLAGQAVGVHPPAAG